MAKRKKRQKATEHCVTKRAALRPDVAERKNLQKATEHSTVKCGVNHIGIRSDFRKRIKSDAARLQTVSFIGTRFAQFVLLRDLKSGEDRFRYDPDEEGVNEEEEDEDGRSGKKTARETPPMTPPRRARSDKGATSSDTPTGTPKSTPKT